MNMIPVQEAAFSKILCASGQIKISLLKANDAVADECRGFCVSTPIDNTSEAVLIASGESQSSEFDTLHALTISLRRFGLASIELPVFSDHIVFPVVNSEPSFSEMVA